MSKIAIVTGNGEGFGKAISEYLPKLGYAEPEMIRSKDYDLTKAEDAFRLIDQTIEKHGRLDLLINNVGNYIVKDFDDYSLEDWQEMMDSNLNSAFYCSQRALPALRKTKGKIINIGFAGLENLSPQPRVIAYQVAKTGLLVMTKGLAKAEVRNGVLVNMVSPGSMVNTVKHNGEAKIPLGRLAEFSEVIQAVEFFITNDYTTGQNIDIAGGWAL